MWGTLEMLKVREIRVLMALKVSQGLPLKEIIKRLEMTPSTAHRILMKLSLLGLIERKNNLYFITTKGEETLKAVEMMLEELKKLNA